MVKHEVWRRRFRQGTIILAASAAVLALGFAGLAESEFYLKVHHSIEVFGKVYKEIATNYVDEIDPDKFMRSGIDGMLKTLDPYTVYIGEKDNDEIDLVTTGKYGGVGITIGIRDGEVTVINLLEGFSAAKQGIEVGDRIQQIDDTDVRRKSLEDIRQLVRGAPGTEVRLKVSREDEAKPLEFVLLREEIPVKNVTYSGYVQEGIGYIRLERFSRNAGDDLRSAMKDLMATGQLKGLVLDLRGNPGGLLDIAVEITSKFLPESSMVVSTRGRKSDADRKYYSTEKPMLPDLPLAVLVDRGSASASEIVAGAIQDFDRGAIVGTRTFGKGLVQTITRLTENTSVKITTARYYTPSGRCIQEIDYTHRSQDGVVSAYPDSLRKEFRTRHNRRVYEAGGIQPDSTVADEDGGRLLDELSRKAFLFKYANHFAAREKAIPEKFEVTNAILSDFESYLKEKGFDYQEEAESKIHELREIASRSRYNKSFDDELGRLDGMVAAEKQRSIQRYEKELKSWLRTEIIGRIKGDRARIESTFADDDQLNAAIGIVKDKKVYQRLLSGKAKP